MTETLRVIDILPEEAKHLAQKLHRKKDEIELIRKAFVAEQDGANDEERSIVARVSTNERDRDGEIVEPKGIDLKDYQANPVLMWSHRYADPPVGKALWSKVDDNGLVCKFQFAKTQFADEIFQLYKGGYLRAFSIGFIPLDFDSREKIHRKISLLEVSAVPVPANQGALVMQEAYAKGIITSDVLKKDFGIADAPAAQPEPEAKVEVVLKPETTENYHRIPVSDGHGDHAIRTITVSDDQGIKALYCVDCKEIVTYLFDVDQWSMGEAREWVEQHRKGIMVFELSGGEIVVGEAKYAPDLFFADTEPQTVELAFAPESDPEQETVVQTPSESISEINDSIRDLALQQNILIKRIDDLADMCARAVEDMWLAATAVTEAEPEPHEASVAEAKAPEEAHQEASSSITITASPELVQDAASQELLEFLRSGQLDEHIRIAIARATGKVF